MVQRLINICIAAIIISGLGGVLYSQLAYDYTEPVTYTTLEKYRGDSKYGPVFVLVLKSLRGEVVDHQVSASAFFEAEVNKDITLNMPNSKRLDAIGYAVSTIIVGFALLASNMIINLFKEMLQ